MISTRTEINRKPVRVMLDDGEIRAESVDEIEACLKRHPNVIDYEFSSFENDYIIVIEDGQLEGIGTDELPDEWELYHVWGTEGGTYARIRRVSNRGETYLRE